MKLTDADIKQIKQFEGLCLTACKADKSERYYTIGYGHYGKDVRRGQTISESEAETLLRKDIATAETSVNRLGVCRTQGEFAALVDFAYNLGTAALRTSTLLRYIRQGKTQLLIVREFMKWTHCGGKVLGGLVKRRQWEAERYVGKSIYKSSDDLKWYIRKE